VLKEEVGDEKEPLLKCVWLGTSASLSSKIKEQQVI